jgi:hypothetical protein
VSSRAATALSKVESVAFAKMVEELWWGVEESDEGVRGMGVVCGVGGMG